MGVAMEKRKRKFRHMTWDDRLRIEALRNAGHSYRFIAKQVGFSLSAVYTEVQRGLYWHRDGQTWIDEQRYSASIAQQNADYQATAKGKNLKLGNNYKYTEYVSEKILSGWSPDAIVGDLNRRGEWTVSTPTLYRYIDAGFIPHVTNSHLLEKNKRKRTYKQVKRASKAPKGKSISQRPEEIETRSTFGHWEMDSVVGKRDGKGQSLLVLTERMTRYEYILRVADKTTESVVTALDTLFANLPKGTFKSITVDNGSEFQDCVGMECDKNGTQRTQVYYCHPYNSSERGSNERINRIIRRFYPKKSDFSIITQNSCDEVAEWINTLPRKILGYATPYELFKEQLSIVA